MKTRHRVRSTRGTRDVHAVDPLAEGQLHDCGLRGCSSLRCRSAVSSLRRGERHTAWCSCTGATIRRFRFRDRRICEISTVSASLRDTYSDLRSMNGPSPGRISKSLSSAPGPRTDDLSSAVATWTLNLYSGFSTRSYIHAPAGLGGDHYVCLTAVSGPVTYTVSCRRCSPTMSLEPTSTEVTVARGQPPVTKYCYVLLHTHRREGPPSPRIATRVGCRLTPRQAGCAGTTSCSSVCASTPDSLDFFGDYEGTATV